MLTRQLRSQVRIAEVRIIEVIESRIAVTLLVERIEAQVYLRIRPEGRKNARSYSRLLVIGHASLADGCHEYARLQTQVLLDIECRSRGKPMRMTVKTLFRRIEKQVLTIQDISCIGRCSLTVALPIISAFEIETAVIRR